jgi:hypothetical protein
MMCRTLALLFTLALGLSLAARPRGPAGAARAPDWLAQCGRKARHNILAHRQFW